MLRNMGMNMTLPTMNNFKGSGGCPIYFLSFLGGIDEYGNGGHLYTFGYNRKPHN